MHTQRLQIGLLRTQLGFSRLSLIFIAWCMGRCAPSTAVLLGQALSQQDLWQQLGWHHLRPLALRIEQTKPLRAVVVGVSCIPWFVEGSSEGTASPFEIPQAIFMAERKQLAHLMLEDCFYLECTPR